MNQDSPSPAWANGAVKIIAALSAAIVAVLLAWPAGDDHQSTVTQNVPVPAGVQVDHDNNQSTAEHREAGARPFSVQPQAASLANAGPDIHEDTRDETPPGITREQADDAIITPDGLGRPQPPAGAQNYRCPPNYVVNQSPVAPGIRRSGIALHFTVSSPGSLRAIWGLFNRPSFGASSNLLLELDGECELIVPWGRKAWTHGAFNSAYESIEIVTNDLSRAQWLAAPILRDGILASIVADRLRARGAPPRLVDPGGCTPLPGVTDHNRLECGNNHWDVGANFPWDVFMAQVRAAYGGGDPVCDAACKKRKRQKAVVDGRVRKHADLHDRYVQAHCRHDMHQRRLREYTREDCRALKRKGHSQHLGITRARRKLRSLA